MRCGLRIALLGLWLSGGGALATTPDHAARARDLDASIDAILAMPAYQWRLPREARPAAKDGVLVSFLKQTIRTVERAARWIADRIQTIADWFARRFARKHADGPDPGRAAGWGDNPRALMLIALIATTAALLLLAARLLVRRRRWTTEQEPLETTPAINLYDERTTADRLPAEEWLAMAEQLEQAGQWRPALRALFLAALAGLGQQGWIRIAPFKSNRDYRRELASRANEELRAAFAGHARLFEQGWYGDWPVSSDDVRQGHALLRRMLNHA